VKAGADDWDRAPRRMHLAIWAAGHWVRGGMRSRWWRLAYQLAWYALYPWPSQRRYACEFHAAQLARLRLGLPLS
jgi:hypothetical protein